MDEKHIDEMLKIEQEIESVIDGKDMTLVANALAIALLTASLECSKWHRCEDHEEGFVIGNAQDDAKRKMSVVMSIGKLCMEHYAPTYASWIDSERERAVH